MEGFKPTTRDPLCSSMIMTVRVNTEPCIIVKSSTCKQTAISLTPLPSVKPMSPANELPTSSTSATCLCDIPHLPFDTSVLLHRDLITSNEHVPPGIVQSIHACMQEHDLKVSQLDKLLDTIEKARELVISRRAEHANLAKAYRDVLSPLRDFPAELLEQIFLLCVRSVRDTLSSHNPPWVFGKVCRRWRSVALSSPRLWNVIPALSSGTKFYTPSRRITMGTN